MLQDFFLSATAGCSLPHHLRYHSALPHKPQPTLNSAPIANPPKLPTSSSAHLPFPFPRKLLLKIKSPMIAKAVMLFPHTTQPQLSRLRKNNLMVLLRAGQRGFNMMRYRQLMAGVYCLSFHQQHSHCLVRVFSPCYLPFFCCE